ncbi:MAG: hypothetical protein KF745_02300 [Phycisphaeraceae bacterium]|nr:hypothetical protein [Phycisphaeraceae bacterium]
MTRGVPTRVIAASMGLAAFAVAVIAGLAVNNPADFILARALLSMFVCWAVGLAVGAVAERTMIESLTTPPATGSDSQSATPSMPQEGSTVEAVAA